MTFLPVKRVEQASRALLALGILSGMLAGCGGSPEVTPTPAEKFTASAVANDPKASTAAKAQAAQQEAMAKRQQQLMQQQAGQAKPGG